MEQRELRRLVASESKTDAQIGGLGSLDSRNGFDMNLKEILVGNMAEGRGLQVWL